MKSRMGVGLPLARLLLISLSIFAVSFRFNLNSDNLAGVLDARLERDGVSQAILERDQEGLGRHGDVETAHDTCASKKNTDQNCEDWWTDFTGAYKDCAFCSMPNGRARGCELTCCQKCKDVDRCDYEVDVLDMDGKKSSSKEECDEWWTNDAKKNCENCSSDTGEYLCARTCCERCPKQFKDAEGRMATPNTLWAKRPRPEQIHKLMLNNFKYEPRMIYVAFRMKVFGKVKIWPPGAGMPGIAVGNQIVFKSYGFLLETITHNCGIRECEFDSFYNFFTCEVFDISGSFSDGKTKSCNLEDGRKLWIKDLCINTAPMKLETTEMKKYGHELCYNAHFAPRCDNFARPGWIFQNNLTTRERNEKGEPCTYAVYGCTTRKYLGAVWDTSVACQWEHAADSNSSCPSIAWKKDMWDNEKGLTDPNLVYLSYGVSVGYLIAQLVKSWGAKGPSETAYGACSESSFCDWNCYRQEPPTCTFTCCGHNFFRMLNFQVCNGLGYMNRLHPHYLHRWLDRIEGLKNFLLIMMKIPMFADHVALKLGSIFSAGAAAASAGMWFGFGLAWALSDFLLAITYPEKFHTYIANFPIEHSDHLQTLAEIGGPQVGLKDLMSFSKQTLYKLVIGFAYVFLPSFIDAMAALVAQVGMSVGFDKVSKMGGSGGLKPAVSLLKKTLHHFIWLTPLISFLQQLISPFPGIFGGLWYQVQVFVGKALLGGHSGSECTPSLLSTVALQLLNFVGPVSSSSTETVSKSIFKDVKLSLHDDGSFFKNRTDKTKQDTVASLAETFKHGEPHAIKWSANESLCVGINTDNPDDQAELVRCSDSEEEMFVITAPNGSGRVRWAEDPYQCLTVKGGWTDHYTPVILWNCSETDDNQLFMLPAAGTRNRIRWTKHDDRCFHFDGKGEDPKPGSRLVIKDCHVERDDPLADFVYSDLEGAEEEDGDP